MSLYAIADLHLSLGTNKPMDVFKGWNNYLDRLEKNWLKKVQEDDTIVIAGDLSWGMNLKESLHDFKYINNLPGCKIIMKGNHDYYFETKTKTENFFKDNNIKTIKILHNNSYEYGDFSICGTRGWINEPGEESNLKVLKREAIRLDLSLKTAKNKPIVFTHYPLIYGTSESSQMLEVLKKYDVDSLYYGHLHAKARLSAFEGERDGIKHTLVSADHLNFSPVKIK